MGPLQDARRLPAHGCTLRRLDVEAHEEPQFQLTELQVWRGTRASKLPR